MTLAPENLGAIRNLLFECSALIRGVGGVTGTGFFVDDRLLLTCAHVVNGPKHSKVRVQPHGRAERGGRVAEYLSGNAADLALVEVDHLDDEDVQPAVVMDRYLEDQVDYLAFGYPKGSFDPDPGIEQVRYSGHRRQAGNTTTQLVFDAGQAAVTPGISGGAVLHPETGAVVGLVQYSNRPKEPLGGGAIPIERAASKLKQIAKLVDDPPLAARRWKEALGDEAWTKLKKRTGWRRALDLSITRKGDTWSVRVDPKKGGTTVGVQNLSSEVAEALFQWAQWRKIRGTKEVNLLGRLLGFAAFPPAVASQIAGGSLAEELVVRMRFEGDNDLSDVPWEFATIKRGGEVTCLSAQKGVAFVRVGSHAEPARVATAAADGSGQVLGIVIAPDDWQDLMPQPQTADETIKWPDLDTITNRLGEAVALGKMQFTPLKNPQPARLQGALSPKPGGPMPDVVHYIGFCRGENKIALSDGEGGVTWRDISQVVGWMFDSGARLIILQFGLPPAGNDWDSMPPRTFLTLRGRVNAVLFTRYPIHPRQFANFNDVLYPALAEDPIESAVQRARTEVAGNQPLNDAAAFGWFTLVTGPQAGMRLVAPPPGDPGGGTRQPNTATTSKPTVVTDPPVRDVFEGDVP